MNRQRGARLRCTLAVGVGVAALSTQVGCIPYSGTQFRETAVPAVQTGVTSIMVGLIDGIFAAVDVESQTDGQ